MTDAFKFSYPDDVEEIAKSGDKDNRNWKTVLENEKEALEKLAEKHKKLWQREGQDEDNESFWKPRFLEVASQDVVKRRANLFGAPKLKLKKL